MELTRRKFLGQTLAVGAVGVIGIPELTGCDFSAQSVIVALLNEIETDWTAFEVAAGKSLPASIQADFSAAVTAIKNWTPGTPGQDVVQALLVLQNGVVPLIPILTPLEQVAAQVVLGSIINIIELLDPSAVPTSSTSPVAAQMASTSSLIIAKAKVAAVGGSVKGKAITRGNVEKIKKDFEARWKSVKG